MYSAPTQAVDADDPRISKWGDANKNEKNFRIPNVSEADRLHCQVLARD